MANIGYLKLSVAGAFYVYDTTTNDLLKIDEPVYGILDDALKSDSDTINKKYQGNLSREELTSAIRFIHRAKERGFFQPFRRKDFFNYYDDGSIIKAISGNMRHLVLNITDQCNLRCTYCLYSGRYRGQRIHNDRWMTWDVARKSIDYFLSRARTKEKTKISFYGGEPLLNWKLVKKCIHYIRQKSPLPLLQLNIVTNATLIRDEMMDFLMENDVILSVSLDGPSRIHDAARISRNGRGTHARVMAALENIKHKDPWYFQRRVLVLSSFNVNNNISQIYDYFSRGIFRDIFVRIKRIRDFDTDVYKVSRAARLRYEKSLDELIDRYINSLRKGTFFKFSDLYHTFPLIFEKFPQREIGPAKISVRPNRSCIPGAQQLFAASDGQFYPCYNFAHQGSGLGNCRAGLDLQKIRKLVQTFAAYCDEMCQECWAFRLCAHCFTHTLENGQMSKTRKMENCLRERERIAKDLWRFVHIWEQEEKYGYHDDLSLHAIVRSHQQEATCRQANLKSKRIVIEDLPDAEHLEDDTESKERLGFFASNLIQPKFIKSYRSAAEVLDFPLDQQRLPLPDGWRGSRAPRRPERLVPRIFLLDYKQNKPRRGTGGEPRQDPSGISIGKFEAQGNS